MQRFEFTSEQVEVLCELIQTRNADLDIEIFRTDTHDFKEALKHRRDVLNEILAKLAMTPVAL